MRFNLWDYICNNRGYTYQIIDRDLKYNNYIIELIDKDPTMDKEANPSSDKIGSRFEVFSGTIDPFYFRVIINLQRYNKMWRELNGI